MNNEFHAAAICRKILYIQRNGGTDLYIDQWMEGDLLTPIKVVNRELEGCKVCGSTTESTKRTVLSNSKGKTKTGNYHQAYCGIDVQDTGRRTVYCCRNCKSKLETLV